METDLFASILLAVYSSVLIVLSLFFVYFNRYAGKTSGGSQHENGNVADVVVILCASTLFFSCHCYTGYL
jgi:hypothetical protein